MERNDIVTIKPPRRLSYREEWQRIIDGSGHWFSVSAVRFFGSRIGWNTLTIAGDGAAYFVTSELPPSGVRAYTVRVWRDGSGVSTVGDLCGYPSRAAAVAAVAAIMGGDNALR